MQNFLRESSASDNNPGFLIKSHSDFLMSLFWGSSFTQLQKAMSTTSFAPKIGQKKLRTHWNLYNIDLSHTLLQWANTKMRPRLGWTNSYKSLYFVHPSQTWLDAFVYRNAGKVCCMLLRDKYMCHCFIQMINRRNYSSWDFQIRVTNQPAITWSWSTRVYHLTKHNGYWYWN